MLSGCEAWSAPTLSVLTTRRPGSHPMPHTDAFYDWAQRVQALFPALRPHHRRALAEYSFGLVLARCCGLTSVVAHLAGFLALGAHALRQRLRELYQPAAAQRGCARSEFDYTLCFGPLARRPPAGPGPGPDLPDRPLPRAVRRGAVPGLRPAGRLGGPGRRPEGG